MRRLLALSAAAALAAACGSSGAPAPEEIVPGGKGGPKVEAEAQKPSAPIDHPPVDPGVTVESAGVRRISVQQLRRSLPVALGKNDKGENVTWLVDGEKGLDKMAKTLGEADFVTTNEDTLVPTPLYAKFMDDAARSVCDQALAADFKQADEAKRTLLRHVERTDLPATAPEAFDANLRYLKLRFHGVKVAEGDEQVLAPLRELFTKGVQAAAGGEPLTQEHVKEGWRLVCVALVNAPEFHVY